jgi:ankyrin repeat protein
VTSWDIQPIAVRGVLSRTESVARDFDEQMKSLNTALQGAAEQSSSGIVAQALEGLAASQSQSIQFVFTRTGACMNAAARATNYYLQGDHEMALHAQAAATSAPQPAPIMPGGRHG